MILKTLARNVEQILRSHVSFALVVGLVIYLTPMTTYADELENRGLIGRYGVNIQELIMKGLEFVGVPYKFGGNSVESGLDCSGFVRLVFKESSGIDLPRTAAEQSQVGTKVALSDLKPGDLVFFNTMRRANSHVGIYLGNNQFVHAPRTGAEITVENMEQKYWQTRFNGARRLDGVTSAPAASKYF